MDGINISLIILREHYFIKCIIFYLKYILHQRLISSQFLRKKKRKKKLKTWNNIIYQLRI